MTDLKFRYRIQFTTTSDPSDPAYYEYVEMYVFTLKEIEEGCLQGIESQEGRRIDRILSRDLYSGRKDKYDKEIYENDVIAESTPEKLIWDGQAIVKERPRGSVYFSHGSFDVKQIKEGTIELTEKADTFLKKIDRHSLNLTCYDGVFQWPQDITVIGTSYEK